MRHKLKAYFQFFSLGLALFPAQVNSITPFHNSDLRAPPQSACRAPQAPLFRCRDITKTTIILCADSKEKKLSILLGGTGLGNAEIELKDPKQLIGLSSSGSSTIISAGSDGGPIKLFLDNNKADPQISVIQKVHDNRLFVCEKNSELFFASHIASQSSGNVEVWNLTDAGFAEPSEAGLYGQNDHDKADDLWGSWPQSK